MSHKRAAMRSTAKTSCLSDTGKSAVEAKDGSRWLIVRHTPVQPISSISATRSMLGQPSSR
jgi:hypothetical protein